MWLCHNKLVKNIWIWRFEAFLIQFLGLFVQQLKISASLQETLHNHKDSIESTKNVEALEVGSSEADKDRIIQRDKSIFRNWPLMSSIIVYCIFSLHDVAYQEVVFLPNDFAVLSLSPDSYNLLFIYILDFLIVGSQSFKVGWSELYNWWCWQCSCNIRYIFHIYVSLDIN